jgi:hypothetical protein
VVALTSSQHPELWLKDALRAISIVFRNKALSSPERQAQARSLYQRTYHRVIECGEKGHPLTGHRNGVGSYNREFAGKWKRVLESACGREGQKLTSMKALEGVHRELSVAIAKISAGKQPLSLYRYCRE